MSSKWKQYFLSRIYCCHSRFRGNPYILLWIPDNFLRKFPEWHDFCKRSIIGWIFAGVGSGKPMCSPPTRQTHRSAPTFRKDKNRSKNYIRGCASDGVGVAWFRRKRNDRTSGGEAAVECGARVGIWSALLCWLKCSSIKNALRETRTLTPIRAQALNLLRMPIPPSGLFTFTSAL